MGKSVAITDKGKVLSISRKISKNMDELYDDAKKIYNAYLKLEGTNLKTCKWNGRKAKKIYKKVFGKDASYMVNTSNTYDKIYNSLTEIKNALYSTLVADGETSVKRDSIFNPNHGKGSIAKNFAKGLKSHIKDSNLIISDDLMNYVETANKTWDNIDGTWDTLKSNIDKLARYITDDDMISKLSTIYGSLNSRLSATAGRKKQLNSYAVDAGKLLEKINELKRAVS